MIFNLQSVHPDKHRDTLVRSSLYWAIAAVAYILLSSFVFINNEKINAISINFEPQDTFPVPKNIPNQLFYLQRTSNTNTIVYALNTLANGELNVDEPVHVFWIRYPEGGQHKELNYIQRKFAYGVSTKKMDNGTYEVHFAAYKKHLLTLMKSAGDKKYHIYSMINGKIAILNRVFIRIDPGGSFWKPNVIYLELKGNDVATGKEVMERLKP